MDCVKTGELIRRFRLEQKMTQKELAGYLGISDKTVSKWERGQGCPDVSLLAELSEVLRIDLVKLLSGTTGKPIYTGVSMKQTAFFVCPVCGNITVCTGNAAVSCCGRVLEKLRPKKAEEHEKLKLEQVEDEWYITTDHPATKENYISFLAFATGDKLQILKQYPEWEIHARIPKREHGKLLWYSTTKGLFYQLV